MKFALKSIVVATAFIAAGAANAASVTVAAGTGVYNGLKFSGSGTLSFSADLLAALDTAKVDVAGYGAATATIDKDSEGYYVSASAAAPITALTIDSTTNAVLGAATVGGATQTATVAVRNVISLGGLLTVTDLNVDLANKVVTGTIFGNNLASKTETLWTIGDITGATTVTGVVTYNTTLSNLKLTTAAIDDFAVALKLGSLGKTTLSAVSNFGSINSTIVATSAVPEASTSAYALAGLALVGMLLSKRRRAEAEAERTERQG